MHVTAQTHVFGSQSGYSTLAFSKGLINAEVDDLSALGFGQTNDRDFLEMLSNEPTAYGRRLRSGRFAITRTFKGPVDDAGRVTLRFLSIVLETSDYHRLCSAGLEPLVWGTSHWESTSFPSGTPIAIDLVPRTARAVNEADLRILDAWLRVKGSHPPLAVLPDDEHTSRSLVRSLAVMDSDEREKFRWGMRLLSTAAPVDVCTLSRVASISGRRRALLCPMNGGWNSSAVNFLAESAQSGAVASLPRRDAIEGQFTPTSPADQDHARTPQVDGPLARRRSSWKLFALCGVVVIGGAVAALCAMGIIVLRPPQDPMTDAVVAKVDGVHEGESSLAVGAKGPAQVTTESAAIAKPLASPRKQPSAPQPGHPRAIVASDESPSPETSATPPQRRPPTPLLKSSEVRGMVDSQFDDNHQRAQRLELDDLGRALENPAPDAQEQAERIDKYSKLVQDIARRCIDETSPQRRAALNEILEDTDAANRLLQSLGAFIARPEVQDWKKLRINRTLASAKQIEKLRDVQRDANVLNKCVCAAEALRGLLESPSSGEWLDRMDLGRNLAQVDKLIQDYNELHAYMLNAVMTFPDRYR